MRWYQHCFLLMAVAQYVERIPAPVDAMAADQAVLDLHNFHQLHLLAIGCRARIFPGHDPPVGEEALLEALALRRGGLEHARDEFSQIVLALHDADILLEQMPDQRAFDRGVLRVERK